MRELIRDLALTLRERVLPHLGSHAARAHEAAAAGGARTVLVVDPIDGTRPALAGLESCCVSVAAALTRIASGQLDAVVEPGPQRLHGAILEAVDAGFARVSG